MFEAVRGIIQAAIFRHARQPSRATYGEPFPICSLYYTNHDTRVDQNSTVVINDELEESTWLSVDPAMGEFFKPSLHHHEANKKQLGSGTVSSVAIAHADDETNQADIKELPTLADFVLQQRTLSVPCYLLRPAIRNRDFYGRQDVLEEIDKALLPRSRTPNSAGEELRSFALSGLGGIGKTQVAIEYAFSRKASFDAIFWIEADESTQLAEGFGRIAAQFGFSDTADADRVVSRNIALEWLANPRKRLPRGSESESNDVHVTDSEATWLVIFNNADNLELLQSYWPVGSSGSILITTRDPFARRGRAGKDLESFSTTDAAALLLMKLSAFQDSPQSKQTSIALATRLGGLPLAIVQIAALVDRLDMTIQEFLDFYEKQVTIINLAQKQPEFLQDRYRHSLLTVWALEYLEPSTTILLRIMSFLNPDRIQESLFTHNLPHDLQPGFPIGDEAYITARADMLRVSLVKRNKDEKELVLHRLVQDVVQAQMKPSEAIATFEVTVRLLVNAWPTPTLRFDHNSATWEKSELLLQHIVRVERLYQKHEMWEVSERAKRDLAQLLLFAGW